MLHSVQEIEKIVLETVLHTQTRPNLPNTGPKWRVGGSLAKTRHRGTVHITKIATDTFSTSLRREW